MRFFALALLLPSAASAAKLDLTSEVRVRFLGYSNLALTEPATVGQSFASHRAKLGVALKGISAEGAEMDVGLSFSAIGIAGSSEAVKPPFDRAAARIPTTGMGPFLSEAFLRVKRPFGSDWTVVAGQQHYRLGGGLLLDDDDVGFAGVSARRELRQDWTVALFYFQPRARQQGDRRVDLAGLSLGVPGPDGLWELNYLFEDDGVSPHAAGAPTGRSERHFGGVRYSVSRGPLSFDGEAAVQRGRATPVFPAVQPKLSYEGSAFLLRGRWRQPMKRFGTGEARLSVGRGTGDNPSTPLVDEAFFPNFADRYDGLERSGFGEFFGATLYDALGPTGTTPTGLPAGFSGIRVFGLGLTSPPRRGMELDFDYYLYHADRSPASTDVLGTELDLGLRYRVQDRFMFKASMASFQAGAALNPAKPSARRLSFHAAGRF